jgi:hypothetical protein
MREHAESEFFSAEDVLAAVKVLLWKRDRSTVPKIKQLLRASMLQHGQLRVCPSCSPELTRCICRRK